MHWKAMTLVPGTNNEYKSKPLVFTTKVGSGWPRAVPPKPSGTSGICNHVNSGPGSVKPDSM